MLAATRTRLRGAAGGPLTNDSFAGATVLDFSDPLGSSLTGQSNVGKTLEAGEPTTAHGFPCGASAWYKFTAPFTGRLTLTILSPTFDCLFDVGQGSSAATYVATAHAEANAATAQLAVDVTAGQVYYLRVTGWNPGGTPQTGTFGIEWTLNDDVAGAAPLHTLAGSVTKSSPVSMERSTSEPSINGFGGASVWFRFKTGATGGAAQLDTIGTNALNGSDSQIAVYTSSNPSAPTYASLTLVVADDQSGGSSDAKATPTLLANKDYFVQVRPHFSRNPTRERYKFSWSLPSVV